MNTSSRNIIIWLFAGCFLIFFMVMVGGITRLTGSGLSITGWKLIRGVVPPLNEQQWNEEFENYKQIPQYKQLNYHFTVDDFKNIYWWEYIHRLLGRIIGMVFIIPFLYFYFTKQLEKQLIRKLLFIFFLGGLQGFLGWYMVKSGLTQNVRVSHIRLAIHLTTAFITFGFTFWVLLGLIYRERNSSAKPNKSFLKIAWMIFFLVMLQIIYGAFVAGLKAGFVYSTFPKMGDEWIAASVGYGWHAEGISSLVNNISMVQFIHRCIAWMILAAIIYLWSIQRKKIFLARQKAAIDFLFAAVIVQFLLGVFTLVLKVPLVLGVAHQAGAFLLFAAIINVLHSLVTASAEVTANQSHPA